MPLPQSRFAKKTPDPDDRPDKQVVTDSFRWRQEELSGIPYPRLRDTEKVWQRWRGDCFAPVFKSDFFLDVPPALASMGIAVDVGNGEPPFRFRYFGSALAQMHTFELTGQTTDAIEPVGFRTLCISQYQAVLKARHPIVFMNDIPTTNPRVTAGHVVLRLPFSDDGENVTQVVSVEEIELDPHEMRQVFSDLIVRVSND